MHLLRLDALPAFIVLYALIFAAFGSASPFWPRFFESRGLSPEQLGLLFGLGTLVRLFAGPLAGRVADLLGRLRAVLATCTALAAGVALLLLPADGFWPLLILHMGQAAGLAPITSLADALALTAASRRRGGFEYGWVRGAASLAFIAGTLVAGQLLSSNPLGTLILVHAALLMAAAIAAGHVPEPNSAPPPGHRESRSALGGVRELFKLALFRRVVLVSALILGSHATHDIFAVVRWNAAGIGPGTISVLWSEAVAAEVIVFVFIGPRILDRLGPSIAAAIAAVAGVVRWIVMAETTALAAVALVQPLHGLTFALLHLACMRLIASVVPTHLAATAQALYALGAGLATALLMLLSGRLYGMLGAQAFLLMALLCAMALPLTLGLRQARHNE
jgi:PPP family 3-phenylpropionic acid transporter